MTDWVQIDVFLRDQEQARLDSLRRTRLDWNTDGLGRTIGDLSIVGTDSDQHGNQK